MQVCAKFIKSVYLIFFEHVSETNACHLEIVVQSGCIKDHSIRRAQRGVSGN